MQTRKGWEDIEQTSPRKRQAAIYLARADKQVRLRLGVDAPPIATQRQHCRLVAERLGVEVAGEFIESSILSLDRPVLREALTMALWQRLNYLIVFSPAHLARDRTRALEVGWHLGVAGTHVVAADSEAQIAFWSSMQSR